MSRKTSQRLCGSDIPYKNTLVPAHGREFGVVFADGEVEDFVAVRAVGLDEAGGGGVEEPDAAVLAAGQDVLACAGGEGHGVDGAAVMGGEACEGGCGERFWGWHWLHGWCGLVGRME